MNQRARKLSTVRAAHTLIVGIDVAKHSHWACIMDSMTELSVGASFSVNVNHKVDHCASEIVDHPGYGYVCWIDASLCRRELSLKR